MEVRQQWSDHIRYSLAIFIALAPFALSACGAAPEPASDSPSPSPEQTQTERPTESPPTDAPPTGTPPPTPAAPDTDKLCSDIQYEDPQWSPDGESIYYTSSAPELDDLHVMTSTGGSDRLLISDAPDPLLSPDGSMVLFKRPNPLNGTASDLHILDVTTGLSRLGGSFGYSASWSPDSKWFTYTAEAVSWPLNKANAATGEVVELTPELGDLITVGQPLWSPDGTTIAFFHQSGNAGRTVYLMPADGSEPTLGVPLTGDDYQACPATAQGMSALPIAWRPDSKALVVQVVCKSSVLIHVVSIEGKLIADLTERMKGDSDTVVDMRWSPDGKQLLYWGWRLKNPLKTITVDPAGAGSVSDPLLLHPNAGEARWSPDGKRIVFVGLGADGVWEIFTTNPDGSEQTRITDNPGKRACED
jgi:Tol biopolymer transport system component